MALTLSACAPHAPRPERPPIRVAVAPEVGDLDPHRLLHGGHAVLSNVFEGLVAFDAQMRVVPALATAWENPDELTWRFQLRPGVHFHDGRLLEAEDVIKSLERTRRPGSSNAGSLAIVDAVRSVAPGVVEIHTSRPNPMLLNSLVVAFIVPRDTTDGFHVPIGTGPYRFLSFQPARSLELTAWPGYWRAAPVEPRLRFVFEPDPGRRQQLLESGAVDVALRLPEDAREAEGGGYRLVWRAAPGVRLIALRVDRPPFSDPRVRRALDLALDREAAVRTLLAGRARPLGQLLPRGIHGYVPDLEPHARDLQAARRLVDQATNGKGLDVSLAHGPGRRREAELIAQQLGAARIRVALRPRELANLSAAIGSGRGDVEMLLWSLIFYTGDASDLFENVLHAPDAQGHGSQNQFGYRDPELDRLVEEAARTAAIGERLTLFQQAMRRVMDDRPLVPLWEVLWVTGVRADVDWAPSPDGWFSGALARRH